jgi:Gly-Xaa carboxypeptidase
LQNGFEPRRTIIFSHGFDEEEVFARRGQGHIAPFLEERYGKDGLLLVIDEGPGYIDDVSRFPIAAMLCSRSVLWSTVRPACDGRKGLS